MRKVVLALILAAWWGDALQAQPVFQPAGFLREESPCSAQTCSTLGLVCIDDNDADNIGNFSCCNTSTGFFTACQAGVPAGIGSPGGPIPTVQFHDTGGIFGGDTDFQWDKTLNILQVNKFNSVLTAGVGVDQTELRSTGTIGQPRPLTSGTLVENYAAITQDMTLADPAGWVSDPVAVPQGGLTTILTTGASYSVEFIWANASGATAVSTKSTPVTSWPAASVMRIVPADLPAAPANTEMVCFHLDQTVIAPRHGAANIASFDNSNTTPDFGRGWTNGCYDYAAFISAGQLDITFFATLSDAANDTGIIEILTWDGDGRLGLCDNTSTTDPGCSQSTAGIDSATFEKNLFWWDGGGPKFSTDGGTSTRYVIPHGDVRTFIVDSDGGGSHTTIQGAIDDIVAAGDCAEATPYNVLVVNRDAEYTGSIDISSVCWTTFQSIGGRARVATFPSDATLPCDTVGERCDNVTIKGFQIGGVSGIGGCSAGVAFFHNFRMEDNLLRNAFCLGGSNLATDWNSATFVNNYLPNSNRIVALVTNGFETGYDLQIVGNRIESPGCFTDGMVIKADGVGDAVADLVANLTIVGNTVSCGMAGDPASGASTSEQGLMMVSIMRGGGNTLIDGNSFTMNLNAADGFCTHVNGCNHAFIGQEDEVTNTKPSRIVVTNNIFRAVIDGIVLSDHDLAFVDLTHITGNAPITQQNQTWYVANNLHIKDERGIGDLPDANTADFHLGDTLDANNTLYYNQHLAWGIRRTGSPVITLKPWSTFQSDDALVAGDRGKSRIGETGEGLYWFTDAEHQAMDLDTVQTKTGALSIDVAEDNLTINTTAAVGHVGVDLIASGGVFGPRIKITDTVNSVHIGTVAGVFQIQDSAGAAKASLVVNSGAGLNDLSVADGDINLSFAGATVDGRDLDNVVELGDTPTWTGLHTFDGNIDVGTIQNTGTIEILPGTTGAVRVRGGVEHVIERDNLPGASVQRVLTIRGDRAAVGANADEIRVHFQMTDSVGTDIDAARISVILDQAAAPSTSRFSFLALKNGVMTRQLILQPDTGIVTIGDGSDDFNVGLLFDRLDKNGLLSWNGTNFILGDQLTINEDPATTGLLLDVAAAAPSSANDSPFLVLVSRTDDGVPHSQNWRLFSDATSFAGNANMLIQRDDDGGGFATVFSFNEGGGFSSNEGTGEIVSTAGGTFNAMRFRNVPAAGSVSDNIDILFHMAEALGPSQDVALFRVDQQAVGVGAQDADFVWSLALSDSVSEKMRLTAAGNLSLAIASATVDGRDLDNVAMQDQANVFTTNLQTLDNNADAALDLILDSGSTTGQVTAIEFRDQGVAKWSVLKSATNDFQIWQASPAIARLSMTTDNNNDFRSGTTTADHVFRDSAGTIRVTIHGDGEIISWGAAADVSLTRTADPNSVIGLALSASDVWGFPTIAGDPNTATWGTGQDGRSWFNSTSNLWRGWDGTAIVGLGTGGSDGVGYDEILDDGTARTKRAQVNFIGGGVSCVDNVPSTRTDCTIAGGGSTHEILSGTHTDTTTATVLRGDLMTGQLATPKWQRLALGAPNTVVKHDGTDIVWGSVVPANMDLTATYTWTGDQDFSGTSLFQIRTAGGLTPVVSGEMAFDSTSNNLEYGDAGLNRLVANLDEVQTLQNKTLSALDALDMVSTVNGDVAVFDFQSNFATDRFVIKQTTGNPTAGDLLTLEWADPNVSPLLLSDGVGSVRVANDLEFWIDSNADAAFVALHFQAGATATQQADIDWHDWDGSVEWSVGMNSAQDWRIVDVVAGDARISLTDGGANTYRSSGGSDQHVFVGAAGTTRAIIRGSVPAICVGTATDTCIERMAAGLYGFNTAVIAPTVDGQIGYDSGADAWEYGDSGVTRTIVHDTLVPNAAGVIEGNFNAGLTVIANSIDAGDVSASLDTRGTEVAWSDPVATDEFVIMLPPVAGTMTRVDCRAVESTKTGTAVTFTINICDGDDTGDDTCTTTVLGSVLECDENSASDTVLSATGFAARDFVTIVITAVSATAPDFAVITITSTVD